MIMVILVSYGLGCLNSGYYLVRWRRGQDIRRYGSGNSGARNAGRILGRGGFAITFVGDMLKGALAVGLALWFKLNEVGLVLALLAVVVGHIWPVQLGWRGGKGVATALGAVLVFDPVLTFLLIGLFGLIWLGSRRFTLSGLVVVAAAPVVAAALGRPWLNVSGLMLAVLLILGAHGQNIRSLAGQFLKRSP
jgi:glycerol-3-phosphate acyltransferase PlsY